MKSRPRKDLKRFLLPLFSAALFLFSLSTYSANPLKSIPGGNLELFWITEADQKAGARPSLPVAAFSAQEHVVTNAEFLAFLKNRPQWRKSRISPLFAEPSYLAHFKNDLHLRRGVPGNAPVNYVSWFAAKAYCESLELRLPTTYEWEYMAAASEKLADANRNSEFLNRILEWYSRPQQGELPAIRSTYKNFYGLWDMHGLVWEWVDDFNSFSVTGESREDSSLNRDLFCGAGNLNGGNKENYAAFMRYAFRSSLKGKGALWNLGFRCVR